MCAERFPPWSMGDERTRQVSTNGERGPPFLCKDQLRSIILFDEFQQKIEKCMTSEKSFSCTIYIADTICIFDFQTFKLGQTAALFKFLFKSTFCISDQPNPVSDHSNYFVYRIMENP
jgi:hypothetical protein